MGVKTWTKGWHQPVFTTFTTKTATCTFRKDDENLALKSYPFERQFYFVDGSRPAQPTPFAFLTRRFLAIAFETLDLHNSIPFFRVAWGPQTKEERNIEEHMGKIEKWKAREEKDRIKNKREIGVRRTESIVRAREQERTRRE